MITGKTKSELLEKLNEIKSVTNADSSFKNGQKIMIEAVRKNGRITGWRVCGRKRSANEKGKGYRTLSQFFSSEEAVSSALQTCFDGAVLCYWNEENMRDPQGRILTKFIVIDPGIPFYEGENGPEFDTITIPLTQFEYDKMRQTSLAFYRDEVVYAIGAEAIKSIGDFLDTNALFRTLSLDRCMLGVAIEIAEKLSVYGHRVNLIVADTKNPSYKIVRSVVSKQYVDKTFIEEALSYIKENQGSAIYDVDTWKIHGENDEKITVKLNRLCDKCTYKKGIAITSGFISGIPLTISSYVCFKGREYTIKCNKMKKRSHSTLSDCFDGLFESVEELDLTRKVFITDEDVDELRKTVGTLRFSYLLKENQKKEIERKYGKEAVKRIKTDPPAFRTGEYTLEEFLDEVDAVHTSKNFEKVKDKFKTYVSGILTRR